MTETMSTESFQPDHYRLFARKLPGGDFRCLVLRDPTPPNGSVETTQRPIGKPEKVDPTEPEVQVRWLHGLGQEMILSQNPPFTDITRVTMQTVETHAEKREIKFVPLQVSNGQPLRLRLFESLATNAMDTPPGATPEEAEQLRCEIRGIVDAFCCTKAKPDDSDERGFNPETESDLVGVPALIQVYLSDLPLCDLAEIGLEEGDQLGPLSLAVLSGYVFDVGAKCIPQGQPSTFDAQISFEPAIKGHWDKLTVRVDSEGVKEKSLPLMVDQEAEGCYLKVDWRVAEATANGSSIIGKWDQLRKSMRQGSSNGSINVDVPLLNEVSDHTLVVWRSVGAAPAHPGIPLGRTPTVLATRQCSIQEKGEAGPEHVQVPEYLFIDRLETRQFVGDLIHYRVELRDMLDRVVAAGRISVRRERLDPPLMPKSAAAELDKQGNLTIVVEIPPDEPGLEPIVWFQTRPLDACGFYGTDDDLALMEGLRQADLNFEEGADEKEPDRDWEGHPVARYLRGAYDRYGMQRLQRKVPDGWEDFKDWHPRDSDLDEARAKDDPVGEMRALNLDAAEVRRICDDNLFTTAQDKSAERDAGDVKQVCDSGKRGLRFMVALRRPTGGAKPIESVLRPCEHFLVRTGADGKRERRNVFQVEAIPSRNDRREFLRADDIALHTLHKAKLDSDHKGQLDPASSKCGWKRDDKGRIVANDPFQIRISILKQDTRRVGGYRVYLRDVLGEEPVPFSCIRQFEAVPANVYRYRPYSIDSSRRLKLEPRPTPTAPEGRVLKPGSNLETTQKLFEELATELRNQSGMPRLARSAASDPPQETSTANDRDAAKDKSESTSKAGGDETKPEPPKPSPLTVHTDHLQVLLAEFAEQERLQSKETTIDLSHLDSLDSLKDTLEKKSEENADEAEKTRARNLKLSLLGHWRVLGPLVDWMHANGFARDLILPLGTCTADEVRTLLKKCETIKDKDWVALVVEPHSCRTKESPTKEPQSPGIMATARLCVLPQQDDLQWDSVDATYRALLPWALSALEPRTVVVFAEADAESEFLPMDGSGSCHLDWNGINDGWRHQIEVGVEALDRYAMARAYFDAQPFRDPKTEIERGSLDERPFLLEEPPTPSELGDHQIGRLEIPRLHPPPDPPALFAVNDPKRVAFRIQDVPERLFSTHNLLTHIRHGPLTTLVQFSYTFPAESVFESLGFGDDWIAPDDGPLSPPPDGGGEPAHTQPNFDVWTPAHEDEVEVLHALHFLEYTVRARFKAGHQEDATKFSHASARRLPGILDQERIKSATLSLESDGSHHLLTIPMVRLWDLLSDAEKCAAWNRYPDREWILKILHWPDLDTTYTILQQVRPQYYAPLFSIEPPGYEGSPGAKFQVRELLKERLGDGTTIKLVGALSDSRLRIEITGAAPDPQPALYVMVSRGDLSAGPIPIQGNAS